MRSSSPSKLIVTLALVFEAVYLVSFYASDGYDVARSNEALRLVATFATVAAMFGVLVAAFARRPRLLAVTSLAVFVPFVVLNFIRFETTGTFDYGFAWYNVRELATPLGRRIVGARVRTWEVVVFLVLPLALAGVAAFRAKGRLDLSVRTRVAIGAASLALVVTAMMRIVPSQESVTAFVASGIRFHAEKRRADAALVGDSFPYEHEFEPSSEARAAAKAERPRPHVILLFLESWSDRYTYTTPPVTPVYAKRRKEGLTFDHFYGNSIQSSRGRFATLCSLPPMIRAKEFFALAETPLYCLPRVLADAGYRTMLASASDEPAFENSDAFFKHIGFADVSWLDRELRGKDPDVWGTGLQDDVFYRRFFERLDRELENDPDPIFAAAINVSHHYPFDENPRHAPRPDLPTKYGRNFVASLARQDAWLETFFEELEKRPAFRDALVVLVGDHSFPADEHGIHFNGVGAREETFRTAFALRWPGHVAPRVVSDRAASQLDVAPTIADLLQLRHRTHFTGHSLVAAPSSAPIPMVQPYDGVRLVAMDYPFKLVVHEAAQQEHLYDVATDPDEAHDLVDDASQRARVDALRQTIDHVRTNDAILHAKRIWSERPPVAER